METKIQQKVWEFKVEELSQSRMKVKKIKIRGAFHEVQHPPNMTIREKNNRKESIKENRKF